MTVKYSKKALKFMSRLDSKSVSRIRSAVAGLTAEPPKGDIKAMQGCGNGSFRLRLGDWRIIYRVDHGEQALFIIEIGNRGDIYK